MFRFIKNLFRKCEHRMVKQEDYSENSCDYCYHSQGRQDSPQFNLVLENSPTS
jgi:hypothetical protein